VKIESLTLERYGAFTDRVLTFAPDATLHIVHGANESGKTSALSAIGDLLFGFGARTAYNFRHDNNALRIGGTLHHSDGRQLVIRRRKGTKNTLLDLRDQPLPDETLTPWLGGLARETFDREFGLTAESLRQGGDDLLKAGGRLAETLAASSAGMSALAQLRERLQREADELFTPRRAGSKAFYVAADQRETADRLLRDSIVTREALRQADEAVRDAEAELDRLNAAHGDSGRMLTRWQRTLRVRSKLARLDAIAAELQALADLPAVTPTALTEWRNALATDEEIARELARLDDDDRNDASDIAGLAVNEPLLAAQAAIEALRERTGAIRKDFEDLPRRRQARDAAQAALDDSARRLGLPSHVALLERLPADPAQALARDLIARRKQTDSTIADSSRRRAEVQRELDDFLADHVAMPSLSDPAQLKQRFDALGDVAGEVHRLRRDTAALKIETDALAAAAEALDPSPGSFERLRALALPDAALIDRFARDFAQNEAAARQLTATLATIDDAIAAAESDLRRLSEAGTMPDRSDLTAARQQRDHHLAALRGVLDGDAATRAARLSDVVRSSQEIDSITDLLLSDTERATRQEDAQQRLAAHRAERERVTAKLAEAQTARITIHKAWDEAWAPLRITPRRPADMARWHDRAADVQRRLALLDRQRAGIDALAADVDAARNATAAFLESVGRSADRALPADTLHREAALYLDEARAAWAEAKARSVNRQRIERDLRAADTALADARRSREELLRAWPAAMAGIALADTASVAEAEAALAVWQDVAVPKASHERETRSVRTMEADIAAFERDVAALADRIAPALKAASALDTVSRLWTELDGSRRANDARQRLHQAAAQRTASRQRLSARHDANALVLTQACEALRCSDRAALRGALDRAKARQMLQAEETQLRRDLDETADGRDEATLRQEREGIDLDLLPGEIERERVRQSQLLQDIAAASAVLQQKKSERDTLLQGRDANAAASERAQASAELLSIAQNWLLRAAAARLAGRAIERHRARMQDPLIARAGDLFAAASDSAFAGLVIDYGDDDQPELKARRSDGERVGIAGLSEGTRDQLFLALRLALLERRAAEPMPFIGDDLLTSFDEARTLATLRLLAAGGSQRQIILFTHHRHVIELARTVSDHRIDCVAL